MKQLFSCLCIEGRLQNINLEQFKLELQFKTGLQELGKGFGFSRFSPETGKLYYSKLKSIYASIKAIKQRDASLDATLSELRSMWMLSDSISFGRQACTFNLCKAEVSAKHEIDINQSTLRYDYDDYSLTFDTDMLTCVHRSDSSNNINIELERGSNLRDSCLLVADRIVLARSSLRNDIDRYDSKLKNLYLIDLRPLKTNQPPSVMKINEDVLDWEVVAIVLSDTSMAVIVQISEEFDYDNRSSESHAAMMYRLIDIHTDSVKVMNDDVKRSNIWWTDHMLNDRKVMTNRFLRCEAKGDVFRFDYEFCDLGDATVRRGELQRSGSNTKALSVFYRMRPLMAIETVEGPVIVSDTHKIVWLNDLLALVDLQTFKYRLFRIDWKKSRIVYLFKKEKKLLSAFRMHKQFQFSNCRQLLFNSNAFIYKSSNNHEYLALKIDQGPDSEGSHLVDTFIYSLTYSI